MANENQLIIEVSADTVELVKALANAKNGLQDFAKDGKTTAATVTSALSAIRNEAKNTFDVTALSAYNKATQDLRGSLDKIRSIGVSASNGINDVSDAAKKSRYAVLGLTQVVRDLPFGFIAISNNIPVLTDQLQELYRVNNNKLLPTLKAFKEAIFGAAGIGFAISAVTTIITYAVKEYGSLGNAIDALFGNYTRLDAQLRKLQTSYDKFNQDLQLSSEVSAKARAEGAGNIQYISSLITTITNTNASYKEQNSALALLREANKTFFGDLTNIATAQQNVNQRFLEFQALTIAQAKVDAFRKLITDTQIQIAQQEELKRQYLQQIELLKNVKTAKIVGREDRIVLVENEQLVKARKNVALIDTAISKLKVTATEFTNALSGSTQELIKANEAAKQLADAEAAIAKESQVQQKLQNIQLERKIQLLQDSLKNIGLLSEEYTNTKLKIIELQGELKKLSETDPRIRAQIDIDTNIAKGQLFKDLDEQYFQEYKKSLQKAEDRINAMQIIIDAKPVKIRDKKLEEINESLEKSIGKAEVPFALKIEEKELNAGKQKVLKNFQEIDQVARGISDTIGNIFGNLFDDITSGKGAIKSLTDSFKELAKQLAIAAIKYAIFNAVKNSLTTAAGVPGGGGTGAGLARFLSFAFGGTPQGTQNAGLSIGQGGLALAGQVTFVQRGPDLVGVLQKANNRINRVG